MHNSKSQDISNMYSFQVWMKYSDSWFSIYISWAASFSESYAAFLSLKIHSFCTINIFFLYVMLLDSNSRFTFSSDFAICLTRADEILLLIIHIGWKLWLGAIMQHISWCGGWMYQQIAGKEIRPSGEAVPFACLILFCISLLQLLPSALVYSSRYTPHRSKITCESCYWLARNLEKYIDSISLTFSSSSTFTTRLSLYYLYY